MKLGTFQSNERGTFTGKLCVLGIGVISLAFEPKTSKDGGSYMRVIADPSGEAYEVGAAFEKQKDDLTYYSISFDSPIFTTPLKAALFPARDREGFYNLIWDRPERPKQEQEPAPAQSKARTRRRPSPAA